MRRRAPRPIRLAIGLAAVSALTLGACDADNDVGEDGGGAASTSAFCERIAELADSAADTTEEEGLDAFRSIADAAPEEISDEMDQLVEAFERLQSFDPEAASEDEMAEFMELAEGLDEASATVEEYARDNCPDLPADFFGTE
jgi:hypothetical protein